MVASKSAKDLKPTYSETVYFAHSRTIKERSSILSSTFPPSREYSDIESDYDVFLVWTYSEAHVLLTFYPRAFILFKLRYTVTQRSLYTSRATIYESHSLLRIWIMKACTSLEVMLVRRLDFEIIVTSHFLIRNEHVINAALNCSLSST